MKLHRYMTVEKRFELRVLKGEKCWQWKGSKNDKGYGQIMFDGRLIAAHRYAYLALVGPIPNGMHVLHECDNPWCVNPKHLRLGTNFDNVKDKLRKGRMQNHEGERNPNAKLSYEKAFKIREFYKEGLKVKDLALMFGVNRNVIGRVIAEKQWITYPRSL